MLQITGALQHAIEVEDNHLCLGQGFQEGMS